MNHPNSYCFFLGANSSQGFYSHFDSAVSDPAISENYIFKGGPGCGKSTAMQSIVDAAQAQGLLCEIIHCSSDPDSLDGALLPQVGASVYDGTAPHIIDLPFPGAQGGYILPTDFIQPTELVKKAQRLAEINAALKLRYQEVFRLTAAAGKMSDSIQSHIAPISGLHRLEKRAAGIIAREIPKGRGKGLEKKRFLSGITPKGLLCYYETADTLAQRIYDLQDPYGFAYILLDPIRKAALASGYDVYACYSPLHPDRLEHLMIPALSLAFVSSGEYQEYTGMPHRRINIAGIIDRESLRHVRGKVRLLQKIQRALLEDAVSELQEAKSLHDQLEALYKPHLNWENLSQQTAQLKEKILG